MAYPIPLYVRSLAVMVYTIVLGAGRLPNELDNELGYMILDVGREYVPVTGRTRRVG